MWAKTYEVFHWNSVETPCGVLHGSTMEHDVCQFSYVFAHVLELYMQYELWKRIWSYWTCSSYRVQGYSLSQTTLLCPSLVRLLYCCRPRPPGVVSAVLQATGLLWRWHPVSSGTIPTCRLERVLNDDRHVLHSLLHPRTATSTATTSD